MNDHNLDDLITHNDTKNSRNRSFLTIIALLIIVLLVGIILAKTLTENSEISNKDFTSPHANNQTITPPELTLKKSSNTEEKEESSLGIFVEEEMPSPMDEALEKSQETVSIDETNQESDPIVETKKEEPIVVEKPTPVIPRPVVTPKPIVIQKPVSTPTPVVENRASQRNKPAPTPPKERLNGAYYIQVGSYRNTPSSQFLSVIRKSGFTYLITAPNRQGIKKLLIGSYPNRESATYALSKVKDRINKNAYIIQR